MAVCADAAPVVVLHAPVADRARFPLERRQVPAGAAGNPHTEGVTTDRALAEIARLLR